MGCDGDGEMGWEARAMGWEVTWGGRCACGGGRRAGRQRIMHQVIIFLSFFLGVEKWRILFLFIHFAKLHDRLKIYHI
jgi:hypothetical protein